MLNKVIIGDNSLDPSTWVTHEVSDVCEFLTTQYKVFPDTARVYHDNVAQVNDVTPTDEAGVERLQSLSGTFYVITYPGDPFTIIAIVVGVATVAVTAYLVSQIPSAASREAENRQSSSPNNELSERENRPRINGRIPDIYGNVRSTPDLIAVPYKVFENHEELEHTYMCIGRGSYDVNVNSIRDDTTSVSDLAGVSVEVYGPNTSPNSNHNPQLSVGTPIDEPVYNAYRSEAVNGQVLRAPNANTVTGTNDTYFVYPDEVRRQGTANDYTDYFAAGDVVTITNAAPNGLNLNGTYTILSVSANTLVLSNPSAVNNGWDGIDGLTDNLTDNTSATLTTTSDKWVGPFVLDNDYPDAIMANFVASGGLYKDDGSTQTKATVQVEVELTQLDANGDPTSTVQTFTHTIDGSATAKTRRAGTLKAVPTFSGKCQVRARRVTPADTAFSGNVVDEVKWRDVYSMTLAPVQHFGNVTTVQSVTYATAGALALKKRKLSMEVTRKIPSRNADNTFTTTLTTSRNAADILCAMCFDERIGNREDDEVDVQNIYDTVDNINAYFGTAQASEFNYTFDSANLSFEESIAMLAQAIFCTAYRRGSVTKLSFEKATPDSTLLFNHRNKRPGVETRSVSFGYSNDHDGVEFEWVDPEDDAVVTMYLPVGSTPVNPKKIESVGIRNEYQAYFHAWRAWQRIRYQNIATEFEATQEAALTVLGDRVLIADNTRPDTDDGDVIAQDGLSVTLSQPFSNEGAATVFLQHYDGTVESLPCVGTADPYVITLDQPPRLPLVYGNDTYARTVYQLVTSDNTPREHAFIVTEKDSDNNYTYRLTAINYDDRYYTHDLDYVNGVINFDATDDIGTIDAATSGGWLSTALSAAVATMLLRMQSQN